MRKRDPSGCQSLNRGLDILRRLAIEGRSGMRLIDLQRNTKLTRPTVHRILGALTRQGLVEQEFETRRYRMSVETGLISSEYGVWAQRMRKLCREQLEHTAEELGDTILLLARAGSTTVCVDRTSGTNSRQALTVDIGTSRPLGVGAGGIAVLSALSEEESTAMLQSLRPRLAHYPNASLRSLTIAVRSARANGYAFSDGFISSSVRGVAVPIMNPDGSPIGALCVAAVYERVNNKTLRAIVKVLIQQRDKISQLMNREGISLAYPVSRKSS
jgi:DNA-binding IclR family transcriptional regulator